MRMRAKSREQSGPERRANVERGLATQANEVLHMVPTIVSATAQLDDAASLAALLADLPRGKQYVRMLHARPKHGLRVYQAKTQSLHFLTRARSALLRVTVKGLARRHAASLAAIVTRSCGRAFFCVQ